MSSPHRGPSPSRARPRQDGPSYSAAKPSPCSARSPPSAGSCPVSPSMSMPLATVMIIQPRKPGHLGSVAWPLRCHDNQLPGSHPNNGHTLSPFHLGRGSPGSWSFSEQLHKASRWGQREGERQRERRREQGDKKPPTCDVWSGLSTLGTLPSCSWSLLAVGT